jgi:hypothetical protein
MFNSVRFYIVAAVVAALLAISIVSCNNRPVVYGTGYAQPAVVAGTPAMVAPPVAVVPSSDGFFSGMLMGHMLSGGYGHTVVHAPVIVNRPIVSPAPRYVPAPTYVPRTTINSRGVTTTRSYGRGVRISGRR